MKKKTDFRKELENILIGMGLKAPVLEIEIKPSGRLGGFVVSETFSGISQIDRQNMLWDGLEKILDEKRQSKIIALLTMTPAEVEATDSYD